jgi:uncharacterized protein (DUF2236 family)
MPASQEHLLGALMAFSVRSLMALDTMHIAYEPSAAEDWMHLWSYVAFLLGIDASLLPIDRASAESLDALLVTRDIDATPAGQRLTAALLDLLDDLGPTRVLRGMPRAVTYSLLGPDIATKLAVPRPGWERWLFAELTKSLRIESRIAVRHKLLQRAVRRVSREIMVGFVELERHEGRPPFSIPTHLHDDWRVGTRARR